jgi:hypothetical protein
MKFYFLGALLLLSFFAGCARHRSTYATDDNAPPQKNAYNPPPQDNHYKNPLSTPGARFGSLPPVVQNTVRSEAGTAEIVDARKEISDGRIFYKISFRDYNNFPPLLVGADGSVLNPDLTVAIPAPQEPSQELKLSDLPPPVKKVLEDRKLLGEVASISHEHWGNHMVYIVSFKEAAHQEKLHIVADGTMLIPAK